MFLSQTPAYAARPRIHSVPVYATMPQLYWYLLCLPIRDGQAELTRVAGYILRQFAQPDNVTHVSTNQVQLRVPS